METIGKQVLLEKVIDKLSGTEKSAVKNKAQLERELNAILDCVKEEVAAGNRVTIQGFGSFAPVERAARTGVNPSTGKPLEIPAKTAVRFKAGNAFKAAVAGE